MRSDETKLVATKIKSIQNMILPSLRISVIAATAEEIEKKTTGETIVKSRFRKISPRGFRIAVLSLNTTPRIEPIRIEPIKISEKV